MEASAKRGPGRPRKPEGEAKRDFFQARIRTVVKSFLEAEAAAEGRSLSEKIETIFEGHIASPPQPLVVLTDEVTRVVDPRGRWRENSPMGEAAAAAIVRGIARAVKRLRTPDDPHVYRDGSVEARVDALLWDLGNDGSEHHGPQTHVHRWSEEIRRRLGDLGPVLIEMRRTVRAHLEAMPPAEPPPSEPEHDELWRKAQERAAARRAEKARQREEDEQ